MTPTTSASIRSTGPAATGATQAPRPIAAQALLEKEAPGGFHLKNPAQVRCPSPEYNARTGASAMRVSIRPPSERLSEFPRQSGGPRLRELCGRAGRILVREEEGQTGAAGHRYESSDRGRNLPSGSCRIAGDEPTARDWHCDDALRHLPNRQAGRLVHLRLGSHGFYLRAAEARRRFDAEGLSYPTASAPAHRPRHHRVARHPENRPHPAERHPDDDEAPWLPPGICPSRDRRRVATNGAKRRSRYRNRKGTTGDGKPDRLTNS